MKNLIRLNGVLFNIDIISEIVIEVDNQSLYDFSEEDIYTMRYKNNLNCSIIVYDKEGEEIYSEVNFKNLSEAEDRLNEIYESIK